MPRVEVRPSSEPIKPKQVKRQRPQLMVTIDPELADKLDARAEHEQRSLSRIVDDVLRAGFNATP